MANLTYARENLTRAVIALVELDGALNCRLREALRHVLYIPPSALPPGLSERLRGIHDIVEPKGVSGYVSSIRRKKRQWLAGEILSLRDDVVEAAYRC